jgi:hypothetical protein
MIDLRQLRDEVVTPTLNQLGMYSPAAERLLLGTALAESNLEKLRQTGGGPALGLLKIEPATADDVLRRYLAEKRPDLNARFCRAVYLPDSQVIDWRAVEAAAIARQLTGNLRFAFALARLRYWMAPERLPPATDHGALGHYWKQYYNTAGGAGRPEKFTELLDRHLPRRR